MEELIRQLIILGGGFRCQMLSDNVTTVLLGSKTSDRYGINEEELFEFRNNIRSLQQRMDALNNRYLNLSTKLDGILIPRVEVNEILNQELTDSNIKPTVSILLFLF